MSSQRLVIAASWLVLQVVAVPGADARGAASPLRPGFTPAAFRVTHPHDIYAGVFRVPPVGVPESLPGNLRVRHASDPMPLAVRRQGSAAAQEPPHPVPKHTGFKALVFETGSDFKSFPLRPSTWVILGIGGAAALLVHPVDDEVNARITGSDTVGNFFAPGKYIGSVAVQAGLATTLYVTGRYIRPPKDGTQTNRLSHLGFDMMRAIIVSQAFTQGIKYATQRERPTGECCAFPSGHASTAFATAAVLERHFGYRAAWPTLLIATYVGASRLHDNRHFLSDVVFGAALGMASGWTVVGRHGRSEYALIPVPTRGGIMVSFTARPSSKAPTAH